MNKEEIKGLYAKYQFEILNDRTNDVGFIKWLDTQSLPQPSESDAVEFAEWLSKNEWIKKTSTHPRMVGKYWSHIHCEYKTIEQLHQLFKSNK